MLFNRKFDAVLKFTTIVTISPLVIKISGKTKTLGFHNVFLKFYFPWFILGTDCAVIILRRMIKWTHNQNFQTLHSKFPLYEHINTTIIGDKRTMNKNEVVINQTQHNWFWLWVNKVKLSQSVPTRECIGLENQWTIKTANPNIIHLSFATIKWSYI